MKKEEILSNIGMVLSKTSFSLKKHSPEILVITGVIGTVASAVLACKATTKVSGIIAEKQRDVDSVHNCLEKVKEESDDSYTEDDAKKDLTIIYIQTGVKFIKLYGPSVALGTLSIVSILTSHNILRKRNVALAAAYTAVDKGFKEYRHNVVDRFGEKVDKELKYGIKAKKFEETTTNGKGKEKTVEKTVDVADANLTASPYARFFDESSDRWEKDSEYNLMFLNAQQRYANDLLHSRGHLFLNEVYDMLGIKRAKAGQVVGWVYDEKNPSGDNYVDFGIYDVNVPGYRDDHACDTLGDERADFVNGYRKKVLLDFNVDGEILNKI